MAAKRLHREIKQRLWPETTGRHAAACHLQEDNNTSYQDHNEGVSYGWCCLVNLWNLISFYQSVKDTLVQVNCACHVITTLYSDKRGIPAWMNTWPLASYSPFVMTVLSRKQESRFRSPEAGSLLEHVVILKSVDRRVTSVPYSVRPKVLQTAGPFERHVTASSWFLMRAIHSRGGSVTDCVWVTEASGRHCKKSPSSKNLKCQCS